MRTLIFIIELFFGHNSFCQDFSYPYFKKSTKSLDNFLPSNWFLKDSAVGDLNGDKIPDLVVVAEFRDTIEEKRPDSSVNTGSPRIILILFKNTRTDDFDLFLQNNTFITRYGEGGMDPDAYGKVSISNNVLNIFFPFIRGHAEYRFRYQQKDFYLIGATTSGVSGGQLEFWDINFNTKKAKHKWGDITDKKLQVKWVNLIIDKHKKLRELSMLFAWEVLPYVFI